MIAKRNNKIWDQKYSEIERYIGGRKCTETQNFINRVCRDNNRTTLETIPLKNQEEYYKKLLTEEINEEGDKQHNINIIGEDVIVDIKTVEKTIRFLKNRKSSSSGGINTEL